MSEGGWDLGRFEMKYAVLESVAQAVVAHAQGSVQPDGHATILASGARGYVVSSTYFDTPRLDDYGARLENLTIRRRMRVRTYGGPGEKQPVFLELKRKREDLVIKQRAFVGDADTWATLGERPWERVVGAGHHRAAAERFTNVVTSRGLIPVVVVRYQREVWVDPVRPKIRLTVDREVQGAALSSARDLHAFPNPVDLLPPGYVVLELKYDNVAPGWVRELVRDLRLRGEPISKFGLTVAKILRADRPKEYLRLVPASTVRGTA